MSGKFPYTVRMSDDDRKVKDSRLELRLSAEEKDLYSRAADQDGRALSNWIRDRLTRAARAELGQLVLRVNTPERKPPQMMRIEITREEDKASGTGEKAEPSPP